jgi:cellulose synthase/poly-beta-1,6-N-acetylglucosamine synthase-like glycosyltransferase
MLLLALLTAASALYWGSQALLLLRVVRSVPTLSAVHAPPPTRWPRLSLIIPARNEERTLEPALRSKLANAYPELELVLVNDRSTDATGAVAESFARTEPRLQVVQVEQLPEGWLGKVHAMQRGLERASGEWVLFSDADIHLAPGVLERVIAYAEHEGLDHVCILPSLTSPGFVLRATLSTFFRLVCTFGRLWAVRDPRSSAAVGVGAFNLVRRSALARTPGLEWLKMEIGDDMALGVMLKRSGARQVVLNGRSEVSLEFYPSYRALTRALEKNGASMPFPVLLVGNLLLVVLEWGLLAGVLSGYTPLVLLGAGTWGVGSAVALGLARWLGFSRGPVPLPFLGMLPLVWATLRSGTLALVRGGVVWRDTFYPTSAVRAGLRLRPGAAPASGRAQPEPAASAGERARRSP